MEGVYQVYNEGNKSWVKMRNGKILANSPEKFEDVPVRQKAPNQGASGKESDSDSYSFFDWD